jgi:hypothetical protein
VTERLAVEQVKLGDLRPYPGNARRGDVAAIADSLEANGQYRPLVVQRGTGYVLAGNGTLQAAQKLGWPSVQVTYLDVDDAQARRIVVADNRTHDLGGYDDRALLALLRDLGDDLTGTGFDADDFDSLLAGLEEADGENPPQPPTALIPGEAPSTPDGGERASVRQSPTYTEYEQQYASRDARFLALSYPPARYVWVIDTAARLADERGLADTADVLLNLLAEAAREIPPAADADVSPEAVRAAETPREPVNA